MLHRPVETTLTELSIEGPSEGTSSDQRTLRRAARRDEIRARRPGSCLSASVANEATVAQLAVVGRPVLFPVRHESEAYNQGLEARVLPERPHQRGP
jgi:hypothetical protein